MTEEYEYVKVTGSIFDLKDDFEAGNLYWGYNNCSYNNRGLMFIKCFVENDLFIGWKNDMLYKRIKKERRLNDGEWYPCVDECDEHSVYMYYNGKFFIDERKSDSGADASLMKWIGKSLGKIKFGE